MSKMLLALILALSRATPAFAQTVEGERDETFTGTLVAGSFFYQLLTEPRNGPCLSLVVFKAQQPALAPLIEKQVTVRTRTVPYQGFFAERYAPLRSEWRDAYRAPEPDWMNMAGCSDIAVAWEIAK